MRLKKKKNQRKFVRFFKACFGFREPFKILCDGTFIHHLVQHSIHLSHLSKLLSSPTKLFVTKCVVGELRSLGESHADAAQTARTFLTARCDHESRRKNAAKCIESVIGGDNSEHFFFATQDVDLRRKFQQIPGVPVIYGVKNSLFLEPPSTHQRQFVRSTEEKRLHISEEEYNMLRKKAGIQVATDSCDADETLGSEISTKQATTKIDSTRRIMGVVDTRKLKRKRAKGPNPLSCKKKNHEGSGDQNKDGGIQDGEVSSISKRKRNRKRKSRQMEGKLSEATNE